MKVEEKHRQILDKWIAALRDKKSEDKVHGYDSHDRRTLAVKGDGVQ